MAVNFYELVGAGGLPAGRAVFEEMIVQLLRVKYPAMGVASDSGDWGIDAFVGDLEGAISIWQSKFFIDRFAESQRQQVRESFKAAVDAAKREGHTIDAWTLCLPVDMDTDTLKWWSGWKRRQELATGIVIDLWSASTITTLLIASEASHVLRNYFPKSAQAVPRPPTGLRELEDDSVYDQSLFVRQLSEAKIHENRSAKRAFFNYEALSREVADKAVPAELEALSDAQIEAHTLWEVRFAQWPAEPETGQLPGLHGDVMQALESHHYHAPGGALAMSVVHRVGGMHHIVEEGDAGWVAHFRNIAEAHRGSR